MKSPFLTLLLATVADRGRCRHGRTPMSRRRAEAAGRVRHRRPRPRRSIPAWTSTSSPAAAGARPTRSRPTRRAGAASTSSRSGTARSCTRSSRAAKDPAATRSPIEAKVGDYYAACMDEAGDRGPGPQARSSPSWRGSTAVQSKKDLFRLLGEHEAEALPTLFRFGSAPDLHDSTQTIASLGQGGLGLPDRDDYLKDDAKSKEKREKYLEHVARMLELAGEDAGGGRRPTPRRCCGSRRPSRTRPPGPRGDARPEEPRQPDDASPSCSSSPPPSTSAPTSPPPAPRPSSAST